MDRVVESENTARRALDVVRMLAHSWVVSAADEREALIRAAAKAIGIPGVPEEVLEQRLELVPVDTSLFLVVDRIARSSIIARVSEVREQELPELRGFNKKYIVTFYPNTYRMRRGR